MTDAKNETAQKREIENNDDDVIEIKRIKIEIRPDHQAFVIERMAREAQDVKPSAFGK